MDHRERSGSPPISSDIQWTDFPDAARARFCKAFLKDAAVLFADPDIQKEFEKWKHERKEKKKSIPAAKQRNAQSLSIREKRTI